MGNNLTTIGLIIVAAAIITAFVLWIRRPEPVLLDSDEPTEFEEMLRPAEDRDWTREALAVVRNPGDPLARPLSEIELAEALLYDEIAAAHPVRLDWAPPTASQAWALAGARLDEMGETQLIAKVEVSA